MATIQARKSRGKKYWYIVESRRVNGKPRPITLTYLGKADDLLRRLNGITESIKLKSYSHGAVAALLQIAEELDVCKTVNKYVDSKRNYTTKKPTRNNLTVGASIMLAAIGRACRPTSKASWANWAKTTSLSYLLRTSLDKIDSQHFWDLMDAIPEEKIENIEKDLLQNVLKKHNIDTDTLFYDTTNFFTYIHTTNTKCDLAKRGRNKQKRSDLRQIGLALVVSQQEKIPLFHLTYEGNCHDSKIFTKFINKLNTRLNQLNLSPERHTLIFDRGNNSKNNFALLTENNLHYVAALVPYQHRQMASKATTYLSEHKDESAHRAQEEIWGEKRTVVSFVSDALKASQLNWFYKSIGKIEEKLKLLQISLTKKNCDEEKVKDTVANIIKKYEQYVNYTVDKTSDNKTQLNFIINTDKFEEFEKECGLRILITNRHDWSTDEIINAYHGQSHIERSFRDLKDPYNLAVRPQFHWTDQKIKVHFFICVLSYLLTTVLKLKSEQNISLSALMQSLSKVRLCTMLEDTKTQGKMKAHYKLEEMNAAERQLVSTLALEQFHLKPAKIEGLRVYN